MNGHFALYYLNNSFYSIDDEIDIQIMEILANGDLSIKKIADKLGKAPSTVAIHLKDLKDNGLLISRTAENDSRSTIYSHADCELIATKRPPVDERDALEDTLDPVMKGELPLIRGIFKMFFQQLENLWLDAVPCTDPVSMQIGKMIAERLQKGDLFTVLAELRNFFLGMNVGEMSFSVSDTVSITVKDVDAHGEMGKYLQGKIISTISRTAMECCSGKRMNMNDLSWTGNDLTVRYSFARF